MEKMIYNRIQWHIESTQHIIPDNQLGFRPDRSCIDNLVILSSVSTKDSSIGASRSGTVR